MSASASSHATRRELLIGIPHEFELYGLRWKVRWGSPNDPFWNAQEDLAQVVDDKPKKGQQACTVTLHPSLRRHPDQAWSAFFHEILHIIDKREPGFRRTMNAKDREKAMRHTYETWGLQHEMMHQIDTPVGRFLAQAKAYIPCICSPCAKRAQKAKVVVGS